MRCKCCDTPKNTQLWGDDWYCASCRGVIKETIREDRMIYSKDFTDETTSRDSKEG